MCVACCSQARDNLSQLGESELTQFQQIIDMENPDLFKWLTPRRMTTVCRRWDQDRNDALQHAWFNGIGYVAWENVWGIWNGMTERDGEALRRIRPLLRYFGSLAILGGEGWEPHTPTAQPDAVYASRFPQSRRWGPLTAAVYERRMICGIRLKDVLAVELRWQWRRPRRRQ